MPIQIINSKEGAKRYKVRERTAGRGSPFFPQLSFDRKIDAQHYLQTLLEQKRKAALEGVGIVSFEKTTVLSEAQHWLSNRRRTMSHELRCKSILTKHILPRFACRDPMTLRIDEITKYRTQLSDQSTPSTANKIVGQLKAILNFSVVQMRIPRNPLFALKPIKVDEVETRIWTLDEIVAFLSFADHKYPHGSPNRWVYIAYLLTLFSGLRSGEVWGMKPRDLLSSKSVSGITVARQLDRYTRTEQPTKGKRQRSVPCPEQLKEELEFWIKQNQIAWDDLIFRGDRGSPVSYHSFKRHRFEKDVAQSELPKIRFHDFRHSACSILHEIGVPIVEIQAIMGHKDIKTTLRYIHLNPDATRRTSQKLTDAFRQAKALSISQSETSNFKKAQSYGNFRDVSENGVLRVCSNASEASYESESQVLETNKISYL